MPHEADLAYPSSSLSLAMNLLLRPDSVLSVWEMEIVIGEKSLTGLLAASKTLEA